MKCALCQINEANKKNTHFLTDFIIRSCLNSDGSNDREKGFYYNISPKTLFTEFNFQRNTQPEIIEREIGRAATDEEIEKTKRISFAVDYIFCSNCEDIFTKIENEFATKFLAQFRKTDLSDKNELVFTEASFRLFFLMQVWRTSVCQNIHKISEVTKEKIRVLLLKFNETQSKSFPLMIAYLETTGGQKKYTENLVGYANGEHHKVIFMNDFVIQFFEDVNNIRCNSLYGINDIKKYNKYINYQEENFIVQIIHNTERKQILNNLAVEKIDNWLKVQREAFIIFWTSVTKKQPDNTLVQSFIDGFLNYKEIPETEKLSEKRFKEYAIEFFKKYGFHINPNKNRN